MKPDFPLSWIGTTTRARDQGLFHLEATVTHPLSGATANHGGIRLDVISCSVVQAACGTRPFAYAGSFPDGSPTVSPGSRCQRCEAMAEKLRPIYCECPGCGNREVLDPIPQMKADVACNRCGEFNVSKFRPVPR